MLVSRMSSGSVDIAVVRNDTENHCNLPNFLGFLRVHTDMDEILEWAGHSIATAL